MDSLLVQKKYKHEENSEWNPSGISRKIEDDDSLDPGIK